jgi:anti-anti-sigma factor
MSDAGLRVCILDRERGHVRLEPLGNFDIAALPEFEAKIGELRAGGFHHLILDLKDVGVLDSAALRAILRLVAGASTDGVSLELTAGLRQVRRISELTVDSSDDAFGARPNQ